MKQYDYSKIILTSEQRKVFKKFMKDDVAFLTYEEFNLLNGTSLLRSSIDGKSTWFDNETDGMCELSQHGEKYRAYLIEKRSISMRDSFRFWFPVSISIAALIVAILAYLKQ